MELFALTERLQKRFRKTVSSDCDVTNLNCYHCSILIQFILYQWCYILTQRVVLLRVVVTMKKIENKQLQNILIFRVWTIWGGHCPECLPVATGLGVGKHNIINIEKCLWVHRWRSRIMASTTKTKRKGDRAEPWCTLHLLESCLVFRLGREHGCWCWYIAF